MRITIEDLEALKELNDELEENHVETEKALQEEIGLLAFILYSLSSNYYFCRCEGHTDSRSIS